MLGPADAAAEPAAEGFAARIGGAYEARISGPGVLVHLPSAGWERKGYFFLADAQGARPHGVTFVLPPGIGAGRHALQNPSPFEVGTVVSVRVDREIDGAVVAADGNASGHLVLDSFPDGATEPDGAPVSGRFAFETEFPNGERVEVEGEFSFAYR